ncbi:NADH-quinone oxidoreductase [Roridomyces roridus]|uniref:NADH-quinone oxidoreductase n=1 Tax=Roridomyces roridus TaxID=1738132 RepID=A0AAD7BLF9_9AGAR|nr:NADH-quinone oxidoreductase [Roridomyces roridus]
MCFPTKKQKANFDEEKPKPTANGASKTPAVTERAAAAASTAPAPADTAPASAPVAPAEPAPAYQATEVTKAAAVAEVEAPKKGPKVAIVVYTMYGHIAKMAEAVQAGIKEAGGSATLYQIPETLPTSVLEQMHAPAKPAYPIMTPEILATYDAFLMGIPTRYGNFPAQWKAFWDSTGGLWATGALAGKYAGAFVSTAGSGGGQETTIAAAISTLTHHGVLFVPLGYKHAFPQLTNVEEVRGGSPWGAGTFASSDGSRQPTPLELEVARIQGKSFWDLVARAF